MLFVGLEYHLESVSWVG